ncbi:MAG: helix-turn-helix domain-containing protein [Pseudonocardiaceae bacterium]
MGQRPRELTPYVSLRHFFGAELRQWCEMASLSHDRLGAQINYSGDLIGKVEKAERAPTTALATACDEALGTGGALTRLVSLIEAIAQQESMTRVIASSPEQPVCGWLLAGQALTVGESPARGADPVNRFEFLVSTFGTGVGALVGPESADVSRLGFEDVATWRRSLSRFYELDDQYGGAGGNYELAVRSLRRLRRTLHQASYGPSTGEALHTLAGELTEHVGWLAFDGGWQAEARYWWLEALHAARLADDDRVSVVVLGSMSQQASELGRSQEAIELAQAAQNAAKHGGTARLRSVLLAWEALGHARGGDERASMQALRRAETLLGAGPHDDDPPWLAWWDEADLAWHEMCAAQNLGKLPLAEHCSRNALAAIRPEYPRNRVLYLAYRAEVLVKQRNLDEAVLTAAQAVVGASEVSSARIDTRIGRVRAELARYSGQPEVAEFLDWSGQLMATKANGSAV